MPRGPYKTYEYDAGVCMPRSTNYRRKRRILDLENAEPEIREDELQRGRQGDFTDNMGIDNMNINMNMVWYFTWQTFYWSEANACDKLSSSSNSALLWYFKDLQHGDADLPNFNNNINIHNDNMDQHSVGDFEVEPIVVNSVSILIYNFINFYCLQ